MITYQVKIIPNKAVFNKLFLWLPIPYDSNINEVLFLPSPIKISQEKKFGNKIAYFEFKKEKLNNSLTLKEKFRLKEEEKDGELFDFRLKDYIKDEKHKKYITYDSYVQSNSPVIISLAKRIAGGKKNLLRVVKDIYEYVLSILTYGNPTFGLYTSLQAFDFRTVDCGGFSTLFCALCQALRLPSRVISGYLAKNAKNSGYHAWSEFMLPNGKWMPVDLAMAKLTGKDYFGRLYEKRIIFCKGTDFSLAPPLPNKEKASILQCYYLRLSEGGKIRDLKVETEINMGRSGLSKLIH